MVVGVGNQNIEHQPPPQPFHVGLRRGAVLAQRVNNFQIASGFIVFRSEHAHRGEERDTRSPSRSKRRRRSTDLPAMFSTRDWGTGMPDFCARDSATASQTTVLISSSLC